MTKETSGGPGVPRSRTEIRLTAAQKRTKAVQLRTIVLLTVTALSLSACSTTPDTPVQASQGAQTAAEAPSAQPVTTVPDVTGTSGWGAATRLAQVDMVVTFIAMADGAELTAAEAADRPVIQTYPEAGDNVHSDRTVSVFVGAALAPAEDAAPEPTALPAYTVEPFDAERPSEVRVTVAETINLEQAEAIMAELVAVAKGWPYGGYFVSINCSTGGTATFDHRLANGKFAVGNLGAAQTGLQAGEQETTVQDGATCPAPETPAVVTERPAVAALDLSTDAGLCAADAEMTNLELNDAIAPLLGFSPVRDDRTFEQDDAIRAYKNAAFTRVCPARAL